MSTAPLTLYLEMEESDSPDAKIAAEAILAWDALVKAVASDLFPELGEIRVELVTTTIGSKRFNTLIRAVLAGDKKALFSLAGGVAAFFCLGPFVQIQNIIGTDVLEFFGLHDYADLSVNDKNEIAQLVVDKLQHSNAAVQKRRLFSVISRDSRISGAGVSPTPEMKPSVIIPRSEFATYAGEDSPPDELPSRFRTRTEENLPVVLIRPILRDGEPMWRFQHGDDPEFSAKMSDAEFMDALRERRTGIEIGIGLMMRVDVQFRDERIGDGWQQKDAVIKRVRFPMIRRNQGDLGFGR